MQNFIFQLSVGAWIGIAAAIIALCGTVVSIFPILAYLDKGYAWRAEVIKSTLSTASKDVYLALYHRQQSDITTSEVRFNTFYGKWYGLSRLTIPTVIYSILVFAYAYYLSIYGAHRFLDVGGYHYPFNDFPVAMAAAAGAYTLVSLDAISRVVRRDLLPEDLYQYCLRLAACIPLGFAFSTLAYEPIKPAIAFSVAAFPLSFVSDFFRRRAMEQLAKGQPPEAAAPADDVRQLSGVDPPVAERLAAIGVSTVAQLAYSDPIQLTMRTNLGFLYVLDMVSQALAWIYFEAKLKDLRPAGLRGGFEMGILMREVRAGDQVAITVMQQSATSIGLSVEQFRNALHEIVDDPYCQFLITAYG